MSIKFLWLIITCRWIFWGSDFLANVMDQKYETFVSQFIIRDRLYSKSHLHKYEMNFIHFYWCMKQNKWKILFESFSQNSILLEVWVLLYSLYRRHFGGSVHNMTWTVIFIGVWNWMSNIKQTLVLVMLLRLLKVRNKIPFSALSPTSVLQSKSPLKAVTTVYSGDSKVLKVDRL